MAVSLQSSTFALANQQGAIAQLVEQRTENPCVPGSIPGGTTCRKKTLSSITAKRFLLSNPTQPSQIKGNFGSVEI